MKLSSSSWRAFTLIEVLVVVGILSLLAAILFPVFVQARDRARITSCASNLHQLGLSIVQYSADYDGRLPYAPNSMTKQIIARPQAVYGEPLDSLILTLPDIRFVLRPYGATTSLFRCPSDQMPNYFLRDDPTYKRTEFEQWGSSYGYDEDSGLASRLIESYKHPTQSILMSDTDNFHGAGVKAPTLDQSFSNVLYVDGHVKLMSWPKIVEQMDEADK